jgi:hypothetical protein
MIAASATGATKSLDYGLGAGPAIILGAATACFLIRLAGIRYNINAPIAREAKAEAKNGE